MVARNKMVISGTLGLPAVEAWSVGFNWQVVGGGAITSQAGLDEWVARAADALTTLPASPLTAYLSSAGRITDVDIYAYSGPGPAVASATAGVTFAGTASPTSVPQAAVGISLRSSTPGASYRGRFYWPALGGGVGNSLTLGLIPDWPEAVADLMSELSLPTDVGVGMQLCVYSPKLEVMTPVNRIEVGNVIDTQRRRRDNIRETYYSVPYPAG